MDPLGKMKVEPIEDVVFQTILLQTSSDVVFGVLFGGQKKNKTEGRFPPGISPKGPKAAGKRGWGWVKKHPWIFSFTSIFICERGKVYRKFPSILL